MIELIEDSNAIKIGRRALRESFPCSYQDLSKYEAKALKKYGVMIGAVFYLGPEVHVAILPQHRKKWMSKRIIREILGIPFSKFGYAVTMGFEKDRDFLERIGFQEQFTINDVTHYRITP